MCSCYRPEGVTVSLRNREKLCLLQGFERCEAAEDQSFQTNLKEKHVSHSISHVEAKKDISINQICQPKS